MLVVERSGRLPEHWGEWVPEEAPTARPDWVRMAWYRMPGQPLVLVDDGAERPVTACLASLVTEPLDNPRIDPYAILSGRSLKVGLGAELGTPWGHLGTGDVYPMLLLMLPNYETALLGAGGRDAEHAGGFLRDVEQLARDTGMRSVCATYVTDRQPAVRRAWDILGWDQGPMTHRCDLEVTWNGFDEYLARLSSKRRVEIRRELRMMAERRITLGVDRLDDTDLTELLDLRLALLRKYGQPADAQRERAVLIGVASTFPADLATVVYACAGDDLIGFTLFLDCHPTWVALMTGTAYGHPGSAMTYFATCYYEAARLAPSRGYRTISYGMGSWEAKRLRGCALAPVHIGWRLLR
jgi:uncharacterized protein